MVNCNGEVLFSLKNVSKTHKSFSLTIDQLEIPSGKVVAIIGGSGSGKTTLLNILSGIDSYQGEINISLSNKQASPLSKLLKPPFANIYQHGYLIKNATVSLNISSYSELHGINATREKLEEICERVQLVPAMDYLDNRAWELSGGEQQRLGIARALFMEPKVIFADEPSSGLDPALRNDLTKILTEWCHDGNNDRTFLWVTHNYDNATSYADKIIVLKNGRIIKKDNLAIFDNPNDVDFLEKMVEQNG